MTSPACRLTGRVLEKGYIGGGYGEVSSVVRAKDTITRV